MEMIHPQGYSTLVPLDCLNAPGHLSLGPGWRFVVLVLLSSWPLSQAFQRAPAALKRYSFLASYTAVAAAGSLNVLFTRSSEISGGIKVTDETGEVRALDFELRSWLARWRMNPTKPE